MGHIFISYSHKDTAYVEKLEKKLIAQGFDVWVDHRIDYGSRWSKEIEHAIDTCDAYIVVMSDDAKESQWVQREVIHAEKRRKPFFPLLLKGEAWFSLGNIQFVDVRGNKIPPKDFYEDIARVLHPEPIPPVPHPSWLIFFKKNRIIVLGVFAIVALVLWVSIPLPPFSPRPTQTPYFPTATHASPVITLTKPLQVLTPAPILPPSNAQLGDTWTRTTDGMVMSYIPAGEFQMGSEDGDDDEKPVHTVYLDAFWMDQTEVTNAMYAECVFNGRCEEPSDRTYLHNPDYGNHPVVYVNWDDAKNYCERVGGRLPTEAEWEKAARGGLSQSTYPWGEGISCEKTNYSGLDGCVDGQTTVVGSYKNGKNLYDLYDMAGNVFEWTADWYDVAYYSISPSYNPLGSVIEGRRVLRGGSWTSASNDLKVSQRFDLESTYSNYTVGFRCSRSP